MVEFGEKFTFHETMESKDARKKWLNLPLVFNVSLLVSALCGTLSSCTDDVEEIECEQTKAERGYKGEGQLRLGKKIPNPYSLKTVQQAYDELTGTRSGDKLSATHLYLKFAPKNIDDLRLLESDTTLYFYSYPLDVELIGEGGGYHDPSLPDTVPTYQYVCAPVDHKLPNVQYEILDEVYYEDELHQLDQLVRYLGPNLKKKHICWLEIAQ